MDTFIKREYSHNRPLREFGQGGIFTIAKSNMLKHEDFLCAITQTNLVKLTFNSNSKGTITRICAPMDFGPLNRSSSPELRYHFIDLDSSSGEHPLSIKPDQILELNVLEDKFDPKNLVHWTPSWHVARDWGIYS